MSEVKDVGILPFINITCNVYVVIVNQSLDVVSIIISLVARFNEISGIKLLIYQVS